MTSVPFVPEVFASQLVALALAGSENTICAAKPLRAKPKHLRVNKQNSRLLFAVCTSSCRNEIKQVSTCWANRGDDKGLFGFFCCGQETAPIVFHDTDNKLTSLHKWPVLVYAEQTKNKKQRNPPPLPHLLESLEPILPRAKARVSRSQTGSPMAKQYLQILYCMGPEQCENFKKLFNPLKSGHFVSYH